MNRKLLIILDYRKMLYSKVNAINSSGINLKLLIKLLKKFFNKIVVRGFEDNFEDISGNDWYVVYQSSEDRGQYYKGYIEDIVYILSLNKKSKNKIKKNINMHNSKFNSEKIISKYNKYIKKII